MQMLAAWAEQFSRALTQARDLGELPRDADLEQLVFEITAMLFRANFAWIMTDDASFLEKARTGVRNVLERITQKSSKGRSRKKNRRR